MISMTPSRERTQKRTTVPYHIVQQLLETTLVLSIYFFQLANKLSKQLPLPETGCLPSVWKFAKCILLGTWQTATLPSAEHKTLDEREALDKVVICRVPEI
jgi:hypothetical protein